MDESADASRRQRAYRILKDRILKGVHAPNQRLLEAELSQELGFSRQTIGLALVRLEQEGLVITQQNRGATVRSFTIPEALRIMRVREALEGVAASLAAENATDAELQTMTAVVEEMYALGESDFLVRYSELCSRLHALILEASGEEMIERIVGSLNHALIRYEYRAILLAGRRERSMAEHRELVASMNARDPTAAEAAMRRHVAAVRETLAKNAVLFSGGGLF
jgi:DNA-binding GntR family transcriptional regulator